MNRNSTPPAALYVHVPFCRSRCTYCDFNAYAALSDLMPAYVDALCRQIDTVGLLCRSPTVPTIYVGGGTPSPLPTWQRAGENTSLVLLVAYLLCPGLQARDNRGDQHLRVSAQFALLAQRTVAGGGCRGTLLVWGTALGQHVISRAVRGRLGQGASPRRPTCALTDSAESIDRKLEMGETMMLGQRLSEGVSSDRFQRRFGEPLRDAFGTELVHLHRLGLLAWDGSVARLTQRGRL